ncbi:alpha/beta hydrolase [Alteromonas sp. 1_MG-2023]|uniref:alpha/beta fold hydrolase n=1 Tax=Alteromonas sp. 1_MG-2023 TaxID=3062669 RepID=UPI0026E2BC69|nr:alpha/beta hydrolase [Alteromonas sp. 1_MG-2023]MDO6569022.1 alpha/beta hydrolase [Alteromonas sp. 1_MG-2023]
MTLVFLHGSGCTSNVWKHQVSFFKNSLALDFPGHPNGEAISDVKSIAQWVLDTIEQEESKDVVLVGHSLGSAVAMQAALLALQETSTFDSNRLKALVLIGAGAKLKVMPQLLTSLATLIEEDGEFPDYLLASNQQLQEPLRTQVNMAIVNNGAAVMLKDFTACDHFNIMHDLANLVLPVQLIVGDKDIMTPVKYSEYLLAQLPNAKLDVIEAGTHMVFAEQYDKVNKCIQRFVAGLS